MFLGTQQWKLCFPRDHFVSLLATINDAEMKAIMLGLREASNRSLD